MCHDVDRAIAFNLAQSTVAHDVPQKSPLVAGFVL
jgi:hypothetical protein